MKKSEFKASIKEEIIDILEAEDGKISPEDIQARKDYNAELERTAELTKEGNNQDDGYVDHRYNDDVIDKYEIPVEPTAVFEEDDYFCNHNAVVFTTDFRKLSFFTDVFLIFPKSVGRC